MHIPFCHVRCTYCAFNTYADRTALIDDYVQALIQEIEWFPDLHVHTIYLGGGTPSILEVDQFARILKAVCNTFGLSDNLEITLEANPGTIDLDKLRAARAAGVTRLSLGMQSAHQHELSLFGRLHDFEVVCRTVDDARRAGFDNLSLDLMYGIPRQTRSMWRDSLRAALALSPDHLSLYALKLESGTELARQVKYKELPLPDDDLAADMYEDATEMLDAARFVQYEISNWARPGKFCQHNLQYWRNLPYLGLGAGAHGYANQTRTVNAMRPEVYIQRMGATPQELPFPQTPATIIAEMLDRETDMAETLFMGLRLLEEGLSLHTFEARYGERMHDRFQDELLFLIERGLLRLDNGYLKLTREARLISNYVFQHFLADR